MNTNQVLKKVIVAALLMLSYSAYANPAHEKLLSISDSKRKLVFAALLSNAGENCQSVTKTFFQGSDSAGNAYWNAACKNADSYIIQANNDSNGSTNILSCKVSKAIGAGTCFTKFKSK